MKPLQLTLNYFGPYRHQQIDFTKFDQTPMFLISGSTGAGKSTIFDGLVFALYDKASGSQRDPRQFRSDFATVEDETSVELTFTHRGRYYHVIRKPRQILAKKRGSGTTEQAPRIELTIYADETPTTEVKQLTKIDAANKYLADILQLNAEQFRQIVLLPQGEFRQFLNGDSNEKEAVLRNLFQTQRYEKWVNQLQLQYKQLRDQNTQRQQQIETLLGQIDWQGDKQNSDVTKTSDQLKLLNNQINQLKVAADTQQQKVKEVQSAVTKQQEELNNRQQIKNAFERQQQEKAKLIKLKQQEPAIQQINKKVGQLKWAHNQQGAYYEFKTTQLKLAETKNNLKQTQEAALKLSQTQLELDQIATSLKDQESEQQTFNKQLIQYGNLVPQYQRVTTLQDQRQQLQSTLESQQQQSQQADSHLKAVTNNIQDIKEYQQQLPDFYEIGHNLDLQEHKLTQLKEQIKELINFEQQIQEITANIAVKNNDLQVAQKAQEEALQNYRQLKNDYALQQIAVLRRDLIPGQECPVCGSKAHPAVTEFHNDDAKQSIVTEEAVEKADQVRQNTEQQVNLLNSELKTMTQQLTTLKTMYQQQSDQLFANFDQVQELATVTSTVNAQQQELVKKRNQLIQQQQIAAQKKLELEDNEQQQVQLLAGRQQLTIDINQQQTKLVVLETEIKDLKQQLPSQFNTGDELADFLKQIEEKITIFNRRRQDLQQQMQQLQHQQTENETNQRHFQQQITEAQILLTKLREELQQVFNQQWPEMDFEEQRTQLEALLRQVDQQEKLETQVSQYQQQLIEQQTVLQQLDQQLQNYSEAPDVQEAQERLQELQQDQSIAQEQLGQVKSQIAQQTKIFEQVQELSANINDITPLQELSELTRGNGSQKLGLERYVLQTYLNEVLLVANQRLSKLTKGRYRLALAQELGNARKNSGLELNVFDDYVGDYRSVKTLSGGESFIAALALALALGEVVQQQTGAIEINALFIDEGFGSLDEEALNMAIEALMSLESQQRMIGIISHVRELQSQIPAQLKVISHGNGESSIQYRIGDV